MAYALVGTIGVASQGTVTTAVTPAWGTGESRTANNLLICFVSVTGSATLPTTPSGWSIGKQVAGTSCSATIYYKIAAGADATPTIASITSGLIAAQLAEFSGNATTTPLDQTGSATGTSSPITATNGAVDTASGELLLISTGDIRSVARATADTLTSNNATITQAGSNNGTSSVNHYSFGYGNTTSKAAADTAVMTASLTNNITGFAVVAATFKRAAQTTSQSFTPTCSPTAALQKKAALSRCNFAGMLMNSGVLPNTVSGLKVWLKADALALSDGAAVATWTDSSGNSNSPTQATSGSRPTFRLTGGPNSLPCVEFDNTDDQLANTFVTGTLTQPYTVIAVYDIGRVLDGSPVNRITLGAGGAGGDFSAFAGIQVNGPILMAANKFRVHSAVFNGSSSQLLLDHDSVLAVSMGTNSLNNIIIQPAAIGEPQNSKVLELCIYSGALSDKDLHNVIQGQIVKWRSPTLLGSVAALTKSIRRGFSAAQSSIGGLARSIIGGGFSAALSSVGDLVTNYIHTGGTLFFQSYTATLFPSGIPIIDDFYSETNFVSSTGLFSSGNNGAGQSFVSAGGVLNKSTFYCAKLGSPTGNAVSNLYLFSGGNVSGSPLATSDPIDVSLQPTSPALQDFIFSGANQIPLVEGTSYAIVVEYSGGDPSNRLTVGRDTTSPTHSGTLVTLLGAWQPIAGTDLLFYVYVTKAAVLTRNVGKSITAGLSFVGAVAKGMSLLRNNFTATLFPSVGGAPTIDDFYSETNRNASFVLFATSNTATGQTFVSNGGTLAKSTFIFARGSGVPTGNIYSKIYAISGGLPTGSALATSDPVDASTTTGSFLLYDFVFSGVNQINLAAGTSYAAIIEFNSGDGSHFLAVGYDSSSPTHSGQFVYLDNTSTWNAVGTLDVCFYVYVGGGGTPSATLIRTVGKSLTAGLSWVGAFARAWTHLQSFTATLFPGGGGGGPVVDDTYSETNRSNSKLINPPVQVAFAQTFTSNGGTLVQVRFYLFNTGSTTGNATVSLYALSGGLPTGTALATSDPFDTSTLTGFPAQAIDFAFSGVNQYSMAAATSYAIVINFAGANLNIDVDDTSSTHAGSGLQSLFGSWSVITSPTVDFPFVVYVAGGGAPAATLTRFPQKALTATLSFVGAFAQSFISGSHAFTQALSATLTSTAALSRRTSHLLTATLSFVGAVTKRSTRFLAATLSFTGLQTASKSFLKSLTATLSFVGAMSPREILTRAFTATLAFSGSVTRFPQKAFTATLSFIGALPKKTSKFVTASLLTTGALTKRSTRALSATLSFIGDLVRNFIHGGTLFLQSFAATLFPGSSDPSAISGMVIRLKSDSLVLSDGDPVSLWSDLSGNSINFTAGGTDRPTFKTNIVNGKPVVRFDGITNTMAAGNTGMGQPDTIVIIGNQTVKVDCRFIETGGTQIVGQDANGYLWLYAGAVVTGDPIDLSGAFHCVAGVFSGGTGTGYIDGIQHLSGSVGGAAFNAPNLMFTTTGIVSRGDLLEVIVYNRALSASELQSLARYSGLTYGTPGASGAGLMLRTSKALSATTSFVGSIVKFLPKSLSATLSFVGRLTKSFPKSFSATLAFVALQTASKSFLKSLAATLSFVGTFNAKQILTRAFTATLNATATLSRSTGKAFAATLAFAASLAKRISRTFSATASLSGALVKFFRDAGFTATLSFVGTLGTLVAHFFTRAFTATLTFSATLTRSRLVVRVLAATLAFSATLRGRTAKVFAATLSFSTAARKLVKKVLRGTLAFATFFFKGGAVTVLAGLVTRCLATIGISGSTAKIVKAGSQLDVVQRGSGAKIQVTGSTLRVERTK